MLPLVRMFIYFTDNRQSFNTIKFAQKFSDKIANPKDAVLMRLHKTEKRAATKKQHTDDLSDEDVNELAFSGPILMAHFPGKRRRLSHRDRPAR